MGYIYEEKRKYDETGKRPGGLRRTIRRYVYLLVLLLVIGLAIDVKWNERLDGNSYLKRYGVETVAIVTGKVSESGCFYIQYTYEAVDAAGRISVFAGAEYVDSITYRAMQIGDKVTIVYAPGSAGYTRLAHIIQAVRPAAFMPMFVFTLPGLALYAIPLWLIRRLAKFLNR